MGPGKHGRDAGEEQSRVQPATAGHRPTAKVRACPPALHTLLPRPHPQEIARLEAQKKHQARLLAQMDARREMRSKEREELVAEGRHIRERLAEEQALLEAVKRLKLAELEEAGVPKKYHAQLARMTVGKPRGLE